MNNHTQRIAVVVLLGLGSLLPSKAGATLAPDQADTFINSSAANRNRNYGGNVALQVSPVTTTLLRFDLSTLPTGTTAGMVQKATLLVWVNQVTTGGSIVVTPITSAWSEMAVTYNTRPTAGTPMPALSVPVVKQYLAIDVTAQVQSWLSNAGTNNGLELTAVGTTSIQLSSKESGGIAPTLDISLSASGLNPQQIALLKWYPAGYASFDMGPGSSPQSLAFDGANMWVANWGNGSVVKIRASDGEILDTFPVSNPFSIAFDGANMWFTNFHSHSVTKMRASDGAVLGVFDVGVDPRYVAFDGLNIWVTSDAGITKLRASDGALVASFAVGGSVFPRDLTFDGSNMWITDSDTNSVIKVRASDDTVVGSYSSSLNYPFGTAFDGANIWVANQIGNTVTKLRASDGTVLGTFNVGQQPSAVAFDGTYIWVTNGDQTVSKLRANDGANMGTFAGGYDYVGLGIAFDGANIWVTNSRTGLVYKW